MYGIAVHINRLFVQEGMVGTHFLHRDPSKCPRPVSNLSERAVEHEKEEFRFGFSRVAGSGQSESARLVPVLLKLPWLTVDVFAEVRGEIMSRIDKERIRKVS